MDNSIGFLAFCNLYEYRMIRFMIGLTEKCIAIVRTIEYNMNVRKEIMQF